MSRREKIINLGNVFGGLAIITGLIIIISVHNTQTKLLVIFLLFAFVFILIFFINKLINSSAFTIFDSRKKLDVINFEVKDSLKQLVLEIFWTQSISSKVSKLSLGIVSPNNQNKQYVISISQQSNQNSINKPINLNLLKSSFLTKSNSQLELENPAEGKYSLNISPLQETDKFKVSRVLIRGYN